MAVRSNPFRRVHHSGLDPREGAEVASAVSMTLAILGTYGAFQQLLEWGNRKTVHPEEEIAPGELEGRLTLLLIPILYFFSCCCLIHGIKKEVRWYLVPYMVANTMTVATFLGAVVSSKVFLNFLLTNVAVTLLLLVTTGVIFYLTLIVISYFFELDIRATSPLLLQRRPTVAGRDSVTTVAKSILELSQDIV